MVQGYAAWYIELSHFTQCLISNEYDKTQGFKKGLRKDIHRLVGMLQIREFSVLVDKATVIEIGIRGDEVDQEPKKRPVSSSSHQGSWKKRSHGSGYYQNTEHQGSQVDQTLDHCIRCHRWHEGECQLFGGYYYSCGKLGHMARDCRAPKRDMPTSSVNWGSNQIPQGTSQANTAPARVYSLTPMDANCAGNVVTGGTHSFVSVNFVKLCGVKTQVMNKGLSVATPYGSVTSCRRMWGGCPMKIQGRLLLANLVVYDMSGMDLKGKGMDEGGGSEMGASSADEIDTSRLLRGITR
ncbi:uncharacterized protein LOC131162732 [Malania oleifera]|uniref:uncharacterized protein LOC131162732 n=1 Tax=Malania oleifera TaxID=397392 RepID=UPI0025AD9EBA|nr:uncharacterized protein LOC131162732 [Malania oleifera]